MFTLPPTPYEKEVPDVPLEEPVEEFCKKLLISHLVDPASLSSEQIAGEFRMVFHVPTHNVSVTYVDRQLMQFGIEVVGVPRMPEGVKAQWFFDHMKEQFQIHLPYDSENDTISRFHELFELIFGRCYHLNRQWATDWLSSHDVTQSHQLADRFAFEIVMPRKEFQAKALETGNDIEALAEHFGVRPVTVQTALQRLVPLDCPLFTARLGFRGLPVSVQRVMGFDSEVLPAEVWKRSRKRGYGKRSPTWTPIETLGSRFPPRHKIVNVDGFASQAFLEGQEITTTTDVICGIRLPAPVYAIARPNSYRSQLFLQAVPVGYENVLQPITIEPITIE